MTALRSRGFRIASGRPGSQADGIVLPAIPLAAVAGTVEVRAAVRPSVNQGAAGGSAARVLHLTNGAREVQVNYGSTGLYTVTVNDGVLSRAATTAGGSLADGVERALAVVWDAAGMRFYVDGVQAAINAGASAWAAWLATVNAVGNYAPSPTNTNGTEGTVRDVRVWDRALTVAELAPFRQLRGDEEGLVAWWPLEVDTSDSSAPAGDASLRTFTDGQGADLVNSANVVAASSGGLDLAADFSFDNYASVGGGGSGILAARGQAGNDFWRLSVRSDLGYPQLQLDWINPVGDVQTIVRSAPLPVVNGQRISGRGVLNTTLGEVEFYIAEVFGGWRRLGPIRSVAGAIKTPTINGPSVEIGKQGAFAGRADNANIYRVQGRQPTASGGIGPVLFDVDFRGLPLGTTTFVEPVSGSRLNIGTTPLVTRQRGGRHGSAKLGARPAVARAVA